MKTYKTILSASLVGASLLVGANAQTVTTIVNNGSTSHLYDMVILAEGYRASEQAQFNQDALDCVNHFRNGSANLVFPYNDYFHCYNVHTVFRASAQSGADQPDVSPPIFVNTAYDASYNVGGTGRCLYLNTNAGRALATADAALAPDTDGRVIVLVNSSRYGGCANQFAVSYNGSQMPQVNAHEWGHSYAGLADEYVDLTGPYPNPEPAAANVTTNAAGNKWLQWIGFAGPNSTVGAYQGAARYPTGIYRPETNCKMRSNGTPFCSVCREEVILKTHAQVTMIRSWSPGTNTSANQHSNKRFQVYHRVPLATVRYQWRIDIGPWTDGSDVFYWNTGNASLGVHTVEVRVIDDSPWIRNDPANDRIHYKTWNVTVNSDTADETHFREIIPEEVLNLPGNSSTSYPFNRSSEQRAMYAYGRDTISPDGPVRIMGVQLRPEENSANWGGATYQFSLDLSTSTRSLTSLSRTFDLNHGADKARVFDGAITVPSRTLGSSPSPFAMTIMFTEAFEWDPRCGPLLFDYRYRDLIGGTGINMDGETTSNVRRIVHLTNADATTADFPSSGTQSFALIHNLLLECAPSPYQHFNTEGNSSSSFPWNRTAGMRVQYVYDENVNLYLDEAKKITRLAWRTDNGSGFSGNKTFDMRVTLSTGVPGLSTALSATFENNHGDDKLVVFDGLWTPDATAINTAPSPFNQVLELQTPFDYSRNRGSLVVDIQVRSASGPASSAYDGSFNEGIGVGRVYNTTGPNATTGSIQDFALSMCVSSVPQPIAPKVDDGANGGSSSSFPWNAATSQRAMYGYEDTALSVYSPMNITHLSWRPDQSTQDFGPVVYNARIDLSTGVDVADVTAMSTTFSNNHGPDQTTVFNGNIYVPYLPGPTTPNDWPIEIKLDRPFRWNPADGPLIVDIRKLAGPSAGGNTRTCDGSHLSNVGRVVNQTDRNASTANFGPQDFALSLRLGGAGCGGEVEPFGAGCSGQNGVPIGSTTSLPWAGNRQFGFTLHDGSTSSNVAMLLGSAPTSIPLGIIGIPCDLLVNNIYASIPATTSSAGTVVLTTGLQENASLNGFSAYFQWACLDATAPGLVTLSNGTRIQVCY